MRVMGEARSEEGGLTDMQSRAQERTVGWNGIWGKRVTLDVTDPVT